MAKGVSIFMGAMRNKLGNQVLYRIADSNDKEKQGARAYVSRISNPRSYAQAKQRAKLIPAGAFFEAFRPVLNHAFLPKANSNRNRFKFFSNALSLDYVPDVPKGESRIPFAPYKISNGNLGLENIVTGAPGQVTDSRHAIKFGLKDNTAAAYAVFGAKTISVVTGELLAANSMLREGYELCFLAVVADPNDMGSRRAVWASFVLDSSDVITTIADILPAPLRLVANGGYIYLGSNETDGIVLSAGLIISARTRTSWTYTQSYMTETTQAIDGIDWDPDDIIATYMTSSSSGLTSDLILQQADNNASQSSDVVPLRLVKVPKPTIDGWTQLSSQNVVAVEMSNGERRLLVAWTNSYQLTLEPQRSSENNIPAFITGYSSNALVGLKNNDTESIDYGKIAILSNSSYAGMQYIAYSDQWLQQLIDLS